MKKILLIENYSADFLSARIAFAKYLESLDFDVYALVPDDDHIDLIKKDGIKVIGYELNRKDKGVRQMLRLIGTFKKVIKEHDFDIIHSFRFQPNLINFLANLGNRRKVVVHITGLGIAFSKHSFPYLLLRGVSQIVFQFMFFRANKVIVQNSEDARDLWLKLFWQRKLFIINGSGINTSFFDSTLTDKSSLRKTLNLPMGDVIFICVTRLIWEKGIQEVVEAFLTLKKSNQNLKLLIVGWADRENPRHIVDAYTKRYENDDCINFLGKRDDIRELLGAADAFIYASYYREGIPRGILEALSMGLPIITTNMPGCNLTVIPGKNGYLILPRSSKEIIESVEKLISNMDLSKMSDESRKLAESKFSDAIIFDQIVKAYQN